MYPYSELASYEIGENSFKTYAQAYEERAGILTASRTYLVTLFQRKHIQREVLLFRGLYFYHV